MNITIKQLKEKLTTLDKHTREFGYYGHKNRSKKSDVLLEVGAVELNMTESQVDFVLNSRLARQTMDCIKPKNFHGYHALTLLGLGLNKIQQAEASFNKALSREASLIVEITNKKLRAV